MRSSPALAALLLAASVAADQAAPAAAAEAQARGHVTGVGGVFVRSSDPKALARWYQDVLGVPVQSWGGAVLHYDQPGHPPVLTFAPFSAKSGYFDPSKREFMLDFAVDDMDAMVARISARGVAILKRDDSDPNGRFAWILDPEGTKIELWEPKAPH
jgi:predicted enzyme related to lactoylglutathione lyase